jgi:streptomycin 3"-adenylyltransferase
MALYGWQDAPEGTHRQINYFVKGCQRIIEHDLVGVYLHGSLAMSTFNPRHSDVDLLVVTREPLSVSNQYLIAAELVFIISGHPSPIEVSYLNKGQLDEWQYPTPFDFHYSESWRKQYEKDLKEGTWKNWGQQEKEDTDLATHIAVLNHFGEVLFGEPIASVFPAVPEADFRDAILQDYRDIRQNLQRNAVYSVLNMCRVLYSLEEHSIGSKIAGGLWALDHLAPEYHPLIEAALAHQSSDNTDDLYPLDEDAVEAFATYIDARLHRQRA